MAAACVAGAAISLTLRHRPLLPSASARLPRLSVAARLHFSRSSGSLSNGDKEEKQQQQHQESIHALPSPASPASAKNFVPVFVTLPANAIGSNGKMTRRRTMAASLAALAAAGVEGVAMELWWGVVERAGPGAYDWHGYLDLVALAGRCGLKVRAIMAFHQCGTGPGDPQWIPLPWWVLEEIEKEPDLAYSDRFGRRNKEYISLGCDALPVLKGRSPIQAYSDFMRSFRDTFRDFLGVIVTEIQVGMGPAGELRYPSCPSEKLSHSGGDSELGEFQCYDKFMLASLDACARKAGMEQWANGGPLGASNLLHDPDETSFFRSNGSWDTSYERFFLEWYSGMLVLHGDRLCSVTQAIFLHTGTKISAKVAGIHWHYYTCLHPSELTAGYYNTFLRDGYVPVARLFSRYGMTLCCTCFDKQDTEEQGNSKSSPEGYVRQLVNAARLCNLSLCGENSVTRLDGASLEQVIKSSRLHSDGARQPSLSFNYVRMDKNLFEAHNWNRFTRFVRRMSDTRTFQAKLCCRSGSRICCTSASEELGQVFFTSLRWLSLF